MRLWIVRHGKADQHSPTGRDFDRPLTLRGQNQASWLGQTIAAKKRQPSVILSSDLDRALHTARLIQAEINCPLEIVQQLQTGHSVTEAVNIIAERVTDPNLGAGLMLVGHNPTFGELVWALEQGLPAREAMMRTGETAVFDFEEGGEFGVGKGTLQKRLRMDEGE